MRKILKKLKVLAFIKKHNYLLYTQLSNADTIVYNKRGRRVYVKI